MGANLGWLLISKKFVNGVDHLVVLNIILIFDLKLGKSLSFMAAQLHL
jgi:hypothetical protein